jgi:sugar phosphate isomerase/epimerase
MKLAVSNVAWRAKDIDGFLRLISSLGCEGVELAASMVWDEPADSSMAERSELRKKIEGAGLKVTGLQALLYTHRDLLLFGGDEVRLAIRDYLIRLMDLCADLKGEVLVFGSPRNRNTRGLPPERAYDIAVDFFRGLGEEAGKRNVFFCIEPLGKKETDFINTTQDAERLIRDAGAPKGLGLHVDVKGLIDSDEAGAPYLAESFRKARHVHLNDPGLMPPGSTGYDHSSIGEVLRNSGYSRYASIEMVRQDGDMEGSIKRAVEYVKEVYFKKP